MVTALGAGVTQTDEKFVGAQGRIGKNEQVLVCHKKVLARSIPMTTCSYNGYALTLIPARSSICSVGCDGLKAINNEKSIHQWSRAGVVFG